MFETDFDEFAALLDGATSLNPNWKPIAPAGKALFFNALAPCSLEQVRSGLAAHLRDPKAGMYQPTPAHVIAQIESRSGGDGRPGADEAWAIALTSRNEADTVVWTAEAASAFAICRPVLDMGDEVGARVAFRDAYNRLVAAARAAGVPAGWTASLGWDVERRVAALNVAVAAGLLPAPAVAGLLPPPETANDDVDPSVAAQNIARIKAQLATLKTAAERAAAARAAQTEVERQDLAARKADAAAKVAGLVA